MNIGIFGGTFNPPHVGHLIAAEAVTDQLGLDRIVFVPSADPPHKSDVSRSTAVHRLEMTRLAISGDGRFEVSDLEVRREGKSYTVDTVIAFGALYPRSRLYLLMGNDNLSEFHTWKSPREIIARCELVVFPRPDFPTIDEKSEFARRARRISIPHIGLSASDIRRRVKMGKSIRYMVTANVEEYILIHGLYRE
jgi:nicotinate-nucleotide adenylyltransferase